MNELFDAARNFSRRQLLTRTSLGLGAVALSSLLIRGLIVERLGKIERI